HFVGLPEAELILAHATTYLACAPKSNASYMALLEAKRDVERFGPLPVPLFVRNAPTRLMSEMGYGKGYIYDHRAPEHFAAQDHLPEDLKGRVYYEPTEQGYEAKIRKRLQRWRRIKRERNETAANEE
ncbi:MAG TPA: replication-associated recombination protein A, partial [Proteobacteria bacterium]|nr:replication-associated recombination protein A [Pseudomonadota bacterium]